MAKTIKEMMQKAFWETDISDHPAKAFEQGYEACANAVLEEIEFLYQHCRDYQLYHLLGLKIKQLKGE